MNIGGIILKVRSIYPEVSKEEIINVINNLEAKLKREILIPAGIKAEKEKLTYKDMEQTLILDESFADMYLNYIMAILAANNADSEAYDNYMKLFNLIYDDIAAYYRRNYIPVKRVKISGDNI